MNFEILCFCSGHSISVNVSVGEIVLAREIVSDEDLILFDEVILLYSVKRENCLTPFRKGASKFSSSKLVETYLQLVLLPETLRLGYNFFSGSNYFKRRLS